MIDNIRNTFIEMLERSTWMDKDSKMKAIEKVNETQKVRILENISANFFKARVIDEKIGYPEYLSNSNTSELENMYREVREILSLYSFLICSFDLVYF